MADVVTVGTHPAFKDAVADLEIKRDKTIKDAECLMTYQLAFSRQQYDQDMETVNEEYENERHNLHDVILMAIEDQRRSIREDKDDAPIDIQELFNDAYARLETKRTLRRRPPLDRSNSSAVRWERRRQPRTGTPHNIHASPSPKEEDELDQDFMAMKV
ncbi:uncharacterized protein BYT42DRAFT_489356 [Radiomyces spectabilis]|uniref:uncharacterized protein n=1 Tax=Radiomyces spectabilis TaxID=64574 RepID=UPI00221F938B|nr:uncharacterized protein BYT42DRAFT_489356 [Radiomyces spectabilis]KAI8391295.1 hypothetical protein BYT42DRAFT_489356 [Radiomyces spectabilis]